MSIRPGKWIESVYLKPCRRTLISKIQRMSHHSGDFRLPRVDPKAGHRPFIQTVHVYWRQEGKMTPFPTKLPDIVTTRYLRKIQLPSYYTELLLLMLNMFEFAVSLILQYPMSTVLGRFVDFNGCCQMFQGVKTK